jgi:hypothetical protein
MQGKVCLSLLGTWQGPGWDPASSTLSQVLLALQSQILVPAPLVNEPAYEGYTRTPSGMHSVFLHVMCVRLATLRHAMLAQLRSPPFGFERAVRAHFALKRDEIAAQAARWAAEAEVVVAYQHALLRRVAFASSAPAPAAAAAAAAAGAAGGSATAAFAVSSWFSSLGSAQQVLMMAPPPSSALATPRWYDAAAPALRAVEAGYVAPARARPADAGASAAQGAGRQARLLVRKQPLHSSLNATADAHYRGSRDGFQLWRLRNAAGVSGGAGGGGACGAAAAEAAEAAEAAVGTTSLTSTAAQGPGPVLAAATQLAPLLRRYPGVTVGDASAALTAAAGGQVATPHSWASRLNALLEAAGFHPLVAAPRRIAVDPRTFGAPDAAGMPGSVPPPLPPLPPPASTLKLPVRVSAHWLLDAEGLRYAAQRINVSWGGGREGWWWRGDGPWEWMKRGPLSQHSLISPMLPAPPTYTGGAAAAVGRQAGARRVPRPRRRARHVSHHPRGRAAAARAAAAEQW